MCKGPEAGTFKVCSRTRKVGGGRRGPRDKSGEMLGSGGGSCRGLIHRTPLSKVGCRGRGRSRGTCLGAVAVCRGQMKLAV